MCAEKRVEEEGGLTKMNKGARRTTSLVRFEGLSFRRNFESHCMPKGIPEESESESDDKSML